MKLWTAWRELWLDRRFAAVFLLNLVAGLVGFLTIQGFKDSFYDALDASSREMQGSDLTVSSRSALRDEDIHAVEKLTRSLSSSSRVSLYTMVAHGDRSRLVELKAIGSDYPYYGKIHLQRSGVVTGQTKKVVVDEPAAWVDPDLMLQLGIQVGDMIQIGAASFRVDDAVIEDSALSWSGMALAPRVYVGERELPATELLTKGSLARYTRDFFLPPDADAEALSVKARPIFKEQNVSIKGHLSASDQSSRLMRYLSDYLSLVSLVALFFAACGNAYLFRSYLAGRQRAIALLLALGATPRRVIRYYLSQVVAMATFGTLVAAAIAAVAIRALPYFLHELINVQLAPYLTWSSIGIALGVAVVGSVGVTLPFTRRVVGWETMRLFREGDVAAAPQASWQAAVWYAPVVMAYWLLAVVQSHSWKVGSAFFGGLVVAVGILIALGLGLLALARHYADRLHGFRRAALLGVVRRRLSALTAFVALALGTMLVSLIPQWKAILRDELLPPADGGRRPVFFLFDIQDEQLQTFKDIVKEQQFQIDQVSPMVRARLTTVNGSPYRRKDEPNADGRGDGEDADFRFRELNLSSRTTMLPSERVTAGAWPGNPWSGTGDAEISLETRFADRLGLAMGDLLTFDIVGVPVTGKVTSLRRIHWTAFQPNFFVQLQEGVLTDAPKTWVASLVGDPRHQAQLQAAVVNALPNISFVDVSEVIAKIQALIVQMSLVLAAMGYLSLGAGFVTIFSISLHESQERRWDFNLLKVLGCEAQRLRQYILWPLVTLGFIGAVLGLALSLGLSRFVSWMFFDNLWTVAWMPSVVNIGLVVLCLHQTILLTARSLFQASPAELLRRGG